MNKRRRLEHKFSRMMIMRLCFVIMLLLSQTCYCVDYTSDKLPDYVVRIDRFNSALEYFSKADENTLVIFDVDNVLIVPQDPYLQPKARVQFSNIYKELTKVLDEGQVFLFHHIVAIKNKSQLVEPDILNIIHKLQQSKVKIIALTGAKTGAVANIIPDVPFWRYNSLKNLGIDFSSTFPKKAQFRELKGDDLGNYPSFEYGIVYSYGSMNSKGDVLKCAIKELNWLPKKIIFVDDRLEHINSVHSFLEQENPNIEFIGLHYQGADKIATAELREAQFIQKISKLVELTAEQGKDKNI